MKKMAALALAACTACALTVPALAAGGPPAPRQERVAFAKGASAATIKGTLKGGADVDYLVRAGAGQTLEVKFESANGQANFNVLPPGSKDVAMFASARAGERTFKVVLPTDGDYAIRVFLERAAARRNEKANFTLTVAVSGTALPPLPGARDAKVKGTAFHATAQVSCLPPFASAPGTCDAGVIRRGTDGTATVELRGNGQVRRILFVGGKPVSSDATEPLTAARAGDTTQVKIGDDERYDIPDPLLTGG
ncbi:MAG: hypothetical protein U1F10_09820 [Burkholderiales bacterium]